MHYVLAFSSLKTFQEFDKEVITEHRERDIKQVQNYRKDDCSTIDVCRSSNVNLFNQEKMILVLTD